MTGARRILVIRLGAVGDVIRTIPALRPLKRLAPGARIAWIAEEGPATLLAGNPLLDDVIVLPRRALGRLLSEPATVLSGLALAGRFTRDLRAQKFDLVIDFHGTFKSGIISAATGASVRVGFAPPGSKEGNRWFNNRLIKLPRTRMHRVERALALVRALGEAEAPERGREENGKIEIDLPSDPRQAAEIDTWLEETNAARRERILLYPGTSQRQHWKRYPVERFAEVARRLAERPGVAVIVCGGPGEEQLVRTVAAGAGNRSLVAPDLDLPGLAELLRRCHLFVGPDTGPMHLAWACGTRVLALFGPTDPVLNAPWGNGHALLYNGPHDSRRDVTWPAPEEVARAAVSLLED